MNSLAVPMACLLSLLLAGCTTTGYSVGGTVTAPETVSIPESVPSQFEGHQHRFYAALKAHGFATGPSNDPRSLRIDFWFDPDPSEMTARVTLSGSSDAPIVMAEAVNNGWGTVAAEDQAIENLIDAAAIKFNEQLSAISFVRVADHDPYNACYQEMFQDQALQAISHKVSLGRIGNQPPFAMLANKSKPSATEKAALTRWGEMRQRCMEVRFTLPKFRQSHDAYKTLLNSFDTNEQSLLIELINGGLTFGGFANKRRDLETSFLEEVKRVQARLQQEADEYAQRERAAAAAEDRAQSGRLADFFQALSESQRPRSAPSSSPTTTNCRDLGFGQITCTTH